MPTRSICPYCSTDGQPPALAPDAWVNVRHGAYRTDRSPDAILRAISTGELPASRNSPRGHYRIRVADLDAWQAGELHCKDSVR